MKVNPAAVFWVLGVAAIGGGIGGLNAALIAGGVAAIISALIH